MGRALSGDTALWPAIALSPIASVISNPRLPDNPLVEVNDAFCALTGYGRDEAIGRNCRFLAGPQTEPLLTETIRCRTRARQQTLVRIRNYKRDGTVFQNAVLVAPMFAADGTLAYFIGSQVEIREDEAPVFGEHEAFGERHVSALAQVAGLSLRQKQVLGEIAAGYRSKEISHHLAISEKTVKMHRALMMERLGISNMAMAIRIAIEAGL